MPKPSKRKLTVKEELFVSYYVACRNATKAAKLAGYSEKSAYSIGVENLSKHVIKEEIDNKINELKQEAKVDAAYIIEKLMAIAGVNMGDFISWDKDGNTTIHPSETIDKNNKYAISSIEKKTRNFGPDISETTIQVKTHDKVRALELLGKYLKMFSDKVEVSGPDGKPLVPQSIVDLVLMARQKK